MKQPVTTMFFIGAEHLPGLSKLVEEAGEVLQVCGKLMANGGQRKGYDGTDLADRLHDEMADLLAAITFVATHSKEFDLKKMTERATEKLALFEKWHAEQHWGVPSDDPNQVIKDLEDTYEQIKADSRKPYKG